MKWFQLLIGLMISGLCLYIAMRNLSITDLYKTFKSIHGRSLCFSLAGILICQALRATRWRRLLNPLHRVTFSQSYQAYALGNLLNVIIPLRGGDILRALIIHKHMLHQPRSAILATIVTERLVDLLVFGLLLGSMLWIYPVPLWLSRSALLIFLGSLSLGLLFMILKSKRLSPHGGQRVLTFLLPLPYALKIAHLLKDFLKGVVSLSYTIDYVKFMLETLGLWTGQALFLYLLMDAFSFTAVYHLDFFSALLMLALTTVAVSLPSSPSYAGTLHLMALISLELCGVPPAPALSYAIVLHITNTIVTLAIGLYQWGKSPLDLSLKLFTFK